MAATIFTVLAVTCGLSAPSALADPGYAAPSVVPQPRYERVGPGFFSWHSRVRIAARGRDERYAAELLRLRLAQYRTSATVGERASGSDVVLQVPRRYDAQLGDEGYALRVRPAGITMRANTAQGLFYALQTLEQISTGAAGSLRSRVITIVDSPAYRWRGIHLDVARHYFPVPVIERYIDLAAHYKLNTFHWHLTDDQAWRLQSDRYPALVSAGAYSKKDVREIVTYAAQRYVTVVPEIDMPAHMTAALRAYPHLSCGRGTICTSGAGLAFARDVFGEVIAEFPSPYVHAGGDEVPVPAALVQPRFTAELERYVRARGRRLIGWDEIFTPQLPQSATVMVWTARKRAAQAARNGNDVILASGPLYFDGAQGDAAQEPRASPHMSTLEQVYSYRVTPAGLTPSEAAHVLGGQANVWTERIATADHLFYMALPRELALAETLWTPRERKSWDSFLARLPAQFDWLERHHYPFRIPNASFAVSGGSMIFEAVPGHVQSVNAWTNARTARVALNVPLSDAVIRYTTNGSAPSPASQAYAAPFTIPVGRVPTRVRAAAFVHGRAGTVTECTIGQYLLGAVRARTSVSKSWSSLVSP